MVFTKKELAAFMKQNKVSNFENAQDMAKERTVYPNEQALSKLLSLAVSNLSKKWRLIYKGWSQIYSQLLVFFEERLKNYV